LSSTFFGHRYLFFEGESNAWQAKSVYSKRNARIGSTLDARWAGAKFASNPNAGHPKYNRCIDERIARVHAKQQCPQQIRHPESANQSRHCARLPQASCRGVTPALTLARPRAQRYADPNLLRPLADGIRKSCRKRLPPPARPGLLSAGAIGFPPAAPPGQWNRPR